MARRTPRPPPRSRSSRGPPDGGTKGVQKRIDGGRRSDARIRRRGILHRFGHREVFCRRRPYSRHPSTSIPTARRHHRTTTGAARNDGERNGPGLRHGSGRYVLPGEEKRQKPERALSLHLTLHLKRPRPETTATSDDASAGSRLSGPPPSSRPFPSGQGSSRPEDARTCTQHSAGPPVPR